MFWIRLGYIVESIVLILLCVVWVIIIKTIYDMNKEEIMMEERHYDINHKTIKDIKIKKVEK